MFRSYNSLNHLVSSARSNMREGLTRWSITITSHTPTTRSHSPRRKRHRSLSWVSRYHLVVKTLPQGPFLHRNPWRFSRVKAHPSRRCLLRLLTLENVLVHCGVKHGSLSPRFRCSREVEREAGDVATLPMLLRSGVSMVLETRLRMILYYVGMTYLMLEEDKFRRAPSVLRDEKLLDGVINASDAYGEDCDADGCLAEPGSTGEVRTEMPWISRYAITSAQQRAYPGSVEAKMPTADRPGTE